MTVTVELVCFVIAAVLLGLAALGIGPRVMFTYAAATLIVIGALIVPALD